MGALVHVAMLATACGSLLVSLVCLVLLNWPTVAHAQTAGIPRPWCYAQPNGGTAAKKVEHADGDGWYHFCVTPTGVRTVVTAKLRGYRMIVPNIDPNAPMQDILNAVWDANVTRKCDPEGTDARIGRICKATFAAADADPDKPKPAVSLWRVAPNSRSTTTPPTRPMWDPTGAKEVSERATVGALCDCSKPLVKNKQTLCPLSPFADPPASGNLAACVKE